jgi:hypothetical protein
MAAPCLLQLGPWVLPGSPAVGVMWPCSMLFCWPFQALSQTARLLAALALACGR